MRLLQRLKPWILSFGVVAGGRLEAQPSPSGRLTNLLDQYQHSVLSDTAYLQGVDTAIPPLLADGNLEALLSTYRKIAFERPGLGKYRMNYYRYMAIHSVNANQYGRAIYYSEKANEEAIRVGRYEKGGIPHSDLFAISVYGTNKNYSRVFVKYDSLRPALLGVPAAISRGEFSGEQAYVAMNILLVAVDAAYRSGDTVRMVDGIGASKAILEATGRQPEKYKSYQSLYNYLYDMMAYQQECLFHRPLAARDYLQAAIREVQSKLFLPRLQLAFQHDTYGEAFDFYFGLDKKDSARVYLGLLQGLGGDQIGFSAIRESILLDDSSRLLASEGQYVTAYGILRRAYEKKDSSFYAVSADKDNNLYALARAENVHQELIRTEEQKNQIERFNFILFLLLGVGTLVGFASFWVYRYRQRQHLLNLQLQLARNFHDEIGPMVLYAGTLVKKITESQPSERGEELKIQITQIMESVRSISHDLKSNRLSTVGSFFKETTHLLEKIRISTLIDFSAKVDNGQQVLSHQQYTHLRKIVNELISNSVKHAGCSRIVLQIRAMERYLRINYSDDGKGWEPGPAPAGIGMQNIRERAALLKGTFLLNNAWPQGYSIELSIPLV